MAHRDGVQAPPGELPTVLNKRPMARVTGLMLCTVAVVLAACGGGTTAAPPTSTPTKASTPGSTSTTLTAAQHSAELSSQVLAAYRDMWGDLVTAAETSDFQSSLLPLHATGDALTLLTQGLARDQLHSIVTRGITSHRPRVTSLSPSVDPNWATVTDCFDDAKWIEYTTGGARAKNNPGGRRATTAELVKSSGVWKVSELTIGATGTC
jgi:hypothetical protein